MAWRAVCAPAVLSSSTQTEVALRQSQTIAEEHQPMNRDTTSLMAEANMDSGPVDLGGHAISNGLGYDTEGYDTEEHIAREIVMLQQEIVKLKKRLNSHRTACRLPVEILEKIFEQVRFTTQTYKHSPLGHTGPYKWIVVTHVCSLWRDVALRSPMLWRHVHMTKSTKWVTEVLSRSKDLPLVVTAQYPFPEKAPRRMLVTVLQKMSRICDLRICASKDTLKDVAQLMNRPAPLLRDISITCNGSAWYQGLSFNVLHSAEQLPNLQRLELPDIEFPWGIPLPPTLRELTFCIYETTLGDVLQTLDTVPGLETLNFQVNIFPLVDYHRIVSLPSLRLLRFSGGDIPHVTSLVDHISFPLQTSIMWTCTCKDEDEHREHFTLVAKLFTRVQWKTLHIGLHKWRVVIRASDVEQPFGCYDGNIGSSTTLNFTCTSYQPDNLVAAFCKAAPLTNVRTLKISCGFENFKWRELFGDLPNLTNLQVDGGMATTLPYALQTHIDDGNGGVHYFAHNLQTLVFDEVNFGNPRFTHDLLSHLETAILTRREHGVNLKKIAFMCCSHVGHRHREQWETLAEQVELECSDTDEDGDLLESDTTYSDEDDEDFDE